MYLWLKIVRQYACHAQKAIPACQQTRSQRTLFLSLISTKVKSQSHKYILKSTNKKKRLWDQEKMACLCSISNPNLKKKAYSSHKLMFSILFSLQRHMFKMLTKIDSHSTLLYNEEMVKNITIFQKWIANTPKRKRYA